MTLTEVSVHVIAHLRSVVAWSADTTASITRGIPLEGGRLAPGVADQTVDVHQQRNGIGPITTLRANGERTGIDR